MTTFDEPESYVPTIQTAFVLLGFLDEYKGGRDIAEDGEKIERFYLNENRAADLFEGYLYKVKDESSLQGTIQRKKEEQGFIAFYSREITAFINSFYGSSFNYDRSITYPDTGRIIRYDICGISYSIFKPITTTAFTTDEFDPRFSFLLGAYHRFGSGTKIQFANATHKAELVARLLREVNSDCVVWKVRQNCVPVQNEIEFTPTGELKALFSLPLNPEP